MITTTTPDSNAQTEATTDTTIAPVAGETLESVAGGYWSPYAAARYYAHVERRAEWLEQRAERFAYRWGF
jgi:hypothetical protein